jgi:hypothetical protein
MSGKHRSGNRVDPDRRKLLRGATVAFGAGAVGAAAIATPAVAAPGDTMKQGQANSAGDATTTIQTDSATVPTLDVNRFLRLEPAAGALPASPEAGMIAVDEFSDLNVAGTDFDQGTIWGVVPSSSWATMTYPVKALRILDTRFMGTYGSMVIAGRSNISNGRLASNRQITLSLANARTAETFQAFPPVGIAINLTVVNTTGDGFIRVWGSGEPPAVSSLNFRTGYVLSNFVETPVGPHSHDDGFGLRPVGAINIYTTRGTGIVVDLVGVISPLPAPYEPGIS